ncbi:hypothetical protein C8Q79DRAFT_1011422 [Trametes meyenii]|nr:hypothetical protein C8Q79DRAFT_1011422 [Trametes meyenii]
MALTTSSFAADPLTINTPAVAKQCEPTLVTWQGGIPAYQLEYVESPTGGLHPQHKENGVADPLFYSVISGGHLIGLFLHINATSFLWPTNVTAGTTVVLEVIDSNVAVAQTAPFVIQPGSVGC